MGVGVGEAAVNTTGQVGGTAVGVGGAAINTTGQVAATVVPLAATVVTTIANWLFVDDETTEYPDMGEFEETTTTTTTTTTTLPPVPCHNGQFYCGFPLFDLFCNNASNADPGASKLGSPTTVPQSADSVRTDITNVKIGGARNFVWRR